MKLVALFLIMIVCSASFEVVRMLEQDEDTGTYYLEVYMGTHLERRVLLIDTLANGTAIDYNSTNSKESVVHFDQPDTVSHAFGTFEGNYTEDTICMEHSQDTCVSGFPFMNVDWKDYKIDSGVNMGGVIPFNRFGFPDQSNQ